MHNKMALINNQQYSWDNIDVILLGRPVVGIRGIEYKKSREKEALYGRGSKAIAIQHGNEKCEGTITLLQSELEALCRAAGDRAEVTALPLFDIVVSYSAGDGPIVVDAIRGVSFTETPKGMKQGDKNAEMALPFIALDIEYGV
jgi:hypothetical protein